MMSLMFCIWLRLHPGGIVRLRGYVGESLIDEFVISLYGKLTEKWGLETGPSLVSHIVVSGLEQMYQVSGCPLRCSHVHLFVPMRLFSWQMQCRVVLSFFSEKFWHLGLQEVD
jgi:hypothetical protein